MTDNEDWFCGDCGTRYSSDVQSCTNPELDRYVLDKWRQGYERGLSEGKQNTNPLEVVKAIKMLNSYGLTVISINH